MIAVNALILGTIGFLRYSLPGAFGEELGWRGFLFPELERMTSFTTASLIGGIVWAHRSELSRKPEAAMDTMAAEQPAMAT